MSKMIPAFEVMLLTPAIRNLIREGKTPQIRNALQTSADLGSITMERAVQKLLRDGVISAETAAKATGSAMPEASGMGAGFMGGFDSKPARPRI